MKSLIYYSLLASGLIFVLAFASGKAFAKEQTEDPSLPDSCTLMAMAPEERTTHLARLKMLRRSASDVKVSSDGFSFDVNLALMSWPDLEAWATSEQKCCSHLKIQSRIVEAGKRATVQVICPAEGKDELIQSLRGKKPRNETPKPPKNMKTNETLTPANELAEKNDARFPNESEEYRKARTALLAEEIVGKRRGQATI